MIQNSAEINFGGLRIVAIHQVEPPHYEMTVTTTAIIFKGSPADFEAMCESHQALKNAGKQLLTALNEGDEDEIKNGLTSMDFALKRAD